MARRLKFPSRSRRGQHLRVPAEAVARPAQPPPPASGQVEPFEASAPQEEVLPPPATAPSQSAPPASSFPASKTPAAPTDETGWNWFAQWAFPTQFFLFALIVGGGVWALGLHRAKPEPQAAELYTPPKPAAPKRRAARITAETFDWLYRLRETEVVSAQLEAEFAEAQQFYRDYALDEFLDFDPWTLDGEEVIALEHFCDQGFFTIEREILLKLFQKQLTSPQPDSFATGASARLAQAAADRESRLASLREAAELYRLNREKEISVPTAITPAEDQARRARLVDKLAAARRERAQLDTRIAEVQSLLR